MTYWSCCRHKISDSRGRRWEGRCGSRIWRLNWSFWVSSSHWSLSSFCQFAMASNVDLVLESPWKLYFAVPLTWSTWYIGHIFWSLHLSRLFLFMFFFSPLLGHHALTCPLAREWICIFSIACIGYMLELLEIDKYLMLPAVVLCCLLLYVDFSLRCNGTIVGYLQNWSFLWLCYLKLISNKRLVRDKLSDKKNTHFNIIYFVH